MSQSKQSKDRQKKVDQFRADAKKKAAQDRVQKTHLIPNTEWQSTDVLTLRGDILDVQEQKLALIWQGLQQLNNDFQHLASTYQMIIQQNINEKKIKLTYKWNNGEPATEKDIEEFNKQMAVLEGLKKKQDAEGQEGKDGIGYTNEGEDYNKSKSSGLVNAHGEPLTSGASLSGFGESDSNSDESGVIGSSKAAPDAEAGDPKLLQEDEEVHYDSNLADEKIAEEKDYVKSEEEEKQLIENEGEQETEQDNGSYHEDGQVPLENEQKPEDKSGSTGMGGGEVNVGYSGYSGGGGGHQGT